MMFHEQLQELLEKYGVTELRFSQLCEVFSSPETANAFNAELNQIFGFDLNEATEALLYDPEIQRAIEESLGKE